MPYHCQLRSRLYSDKAVQTAPLAAIRHGTDSSGAVLSSGMADLAINELLSRSGSAYRQSKPSGTPTPLSRGRKTWLDYNHPCGDFCGVQRRVVSDPESVTCEPKTPYSDSERLRVVSLPEPTSLRSCVSISKYQNQEPEQQSPGNREYPSDLPHTPSPPSSPDSVVIVGIETGVPSSFFQPLVDEKGWTTWANSPPRPIPALHGPSSLPYARCPSGAEGTVVEGDDLATKVWGLGSDEGHRLRLKSPQPPWISANFASLPQDGNFDYQTVTSSALARHRDAVIDLIKPSTFYCYPDANESTGGRLVSFDGAYSPPAGHTGRPNAHARFYQDMHSANVATASTDGHPERSSALGREVVGRSQGLPQILPPPYFSRQSNLNSAAPSFIPAYPTRNSERACIQQDAEFSDFETTRDLGQQVKSDLTPATTASPLWSPVFQSVPTVVLGDYDPRIYSPQIDLDSYSNRFVTQQLTNEDFVQQRPHAEQGVKSSIKTFYPQPYVTNNGVGMKDADAMDATRSPTLASCGLTEANRVDSCERRDHQAPRSIPMTRLMQRRLSSVAEETKCSSYELSTGHPMHKGPKRPALVLGQSQVSNGPEISAEGELSSLRGL